MHLLYWYDLNSLKTLVTQKKIHLADMQKFPLRMKDNDLLVTELYKDPNSDPVTAISVYLTPKTSKCMRLCFG